MDKMIKDIDIDHNHHHCFIYDDLNNVKKLLYEKVSTWNL